MKRKLIPPFLTLLAGAISSIIMFSLHYETKSMLIILLGILVGFYIIGSLLKMMLDIFDRQNDVSVSDDTEETAEEIPADMEEGQVKAEN